MRLTELPFGLPARVAAVDWAGLPDGDVQRLRELGMWEGAVVTVLHRAGLMGRGALACKVGRMMIAMRHDHARVIEVEADRA